MESNDSKEYTLSDIESVPSNNIVIQTVTNYNAKDNVKTSTYYLKLENERDSKENENVAYVSIENETLASEAIEDDANAEYVALEVQDSGQIVLHEKDVILWGELCRICANGCDQLVPIFTGEGLENNLSQKIHAHLPVTVSENDDLPHQLCYNCAATLIAYDDIHKGCVDAQQRLNDLHSKLVSKEQFEATQAEDENFDTIFEENENEIDSVKQPLQENIKETIQQDNFLEAERLKGTAEKGIKISFKQFKKTLKTSPIKVKSEKVVQASSKPIKKRVSQIVKKKLVVKHVKTEKAESKINKKRDAEIMESANFITDDFANDSSSEDQFASTSPDPPPKPPTKSKKRSTTTKMHECNLCKKRFRNANLYENHMRVHSGEKPYSCHICGTKFGPVGSLYYHLKHVHGGVKNHACDVCGRCFAMKSAMEDHRRIHTDERPFVCDSCGKTFRTRASLFIHSRIHTDEFPFKCSYCNKFFRWKHQMNNHETTHTGEKNHICDICGKGFGVKNELSRHRFTHSMEKPFSCPKCELSFGQKRYLTKHIRMRH